MTTLVYAKGFEVTKQAGPFSVTVMLDKNPPVVGNNAVTVAIKDAAGIAVTNATVRLEYGMPAMPGMHPMHYKAATQVRGALYAGTLNFSMAGPWYLNVKIVRDGKTETVKLNIDIR